MKSFCPMLDPAMHEWHVKFSNPFLSLLPGLSRLPHPILTKRSRVSYGLYAFSGRSIDRQERPPTVAKIPYQPGMLLKEGRKKERRKERYDGGNKCSINLCSFHTVHPLFETAMNDASLMLLLCFLSLPGSWARLASLEPSLHHHIQVNPFLGSQVCCLSFSAFGERCRTYLYTL